MPRPPTVAGGGGRVLGLVGSASTSWAAPAAVERTESFIATFKKVKSGEKLTAADKKANEQVFAEIDKFMDFETLTTKPIEPRASKFSAKQKSGVHQQVPGRSSAHRLPQLGRLLPRRQDEDWRAGGKGAVTVVPIDASMPKEDLKTKLEFYWAKKGGTLKLVDVAFDGDSLIKDYQNQFARIIDKEGRGRAAQEAGREEGRAGRGRGKEARAAK